MSLAPDKDNSFEEEKDPAVVPFENEEESTIFSAPVEHKDAKKGAGLIRKSLLAVVIFAVVLSTALSIWIYVPKADDVDGSSSSSKIEESPLWALDSDKYSTVTLTAKDKSIVLYSSSPEQTSSEEEAEKEWLIKGVDNSLISTMRTGSFIYSVCFIDYIKTMDNPDADYGFDAPSFIVKLDGIDPADNKVLTVGASTADSNSVYVKTSDSSSIYLVDSDSFSGFTTDVLSFADTKGIPPLAKDSDYNGEYYSGGVLQTFDRLVISSSALTHTLTVEPNLGETSFGAYVISSPSKRYANTDNIVTVFEFFSNGLSGDGVYSLDNSSKEQKRFGLLEPDFTATIYVDKEKRSLKARRQSDGNYAVVGDGLAVILKVPEESLSAATFSDVNFFSNFLFIESLSEIDTMTFTQGDISHSFAVTPEYTTNANGGEEKNIKSVKANGKEIDLSNFQNFYEHLLWISAVEFNFTDTSSLKADTTIHITHNDGTKDTLIEYFKISDMRYQMEVNGEKMGVISSSSYKNIFRQADNVANGKNYSS